MFSVVSVLYIKNNRICNLFSSHLINEYIRDPDHTSSPHPSHTTLFGWKLLLTRMHSSGMRTTRLLPISPSMHCSWGVSAPRGCLLWGGAFAPGWCLLPGGGGCLLLSLHRARGVGIPACTEADPPPREQNHRRVKI